MGRTLSARLGRTVWSAMSAILAIAMLAWTQAGPLGKVAASPVGRWQANINGAPVVLELGEDGSMVFAGHPGTYSWKPGSLFVNLGGETGTYGLALEGGSLFLTGVDLGGTVEFSRLDSGGAASPRPAAAAAPGSSQAKALKFDLYAFQADGSVLVGHPSGWTWEEFGDDSMLGVMFQERQTPDSSGIITMVVPIATATGITNSGELAVLLLGLLQQSVLPDLAVIGHGTHPQASEVTITDITATDSGIPYRGHLCCALVPAGPYANIGVFSLFYAAQSRWASYNVEQMLTGNMAPLFGSIARLATANQQQAEGWTPPSYDGYAYGMGGYSGGMLSEETMSPAEEMMAMEGMTAQHDAIINGIATMGESTYDAGWYGDTYVDGNGFSYDYGGYEGYY